jgi:glutamate racemase
MSRLAHALPSSPGGAAGVRIGVFDSGLGGLSVLQALRHQVPGAELLYVADSGHAPYGERDVAHITTRSGHITRFLLTQGAQIIVVACNTATAAAVQHLRHTWPAVPIVGVEPGIKPALAMSPTGRIGVMATPATLGSERFRALLNRHADNAKVTLQACPGLAREIEHGLLDSPKLRQLVQGFTAPLKGAEVDTVVLGCTHYPFVRHLIQEEMGPDVTIVDTSDAVARQCARQLPEFPEAVSTTSLLGRISLWSSGPPGHLAQVVRHWLDIKAEARPLP